MSSYSSFQRNSDCWCFNNYTITVLAFGPLTNFPLIIIFSEDKSSSIEPSLMFETTPSVIFSSNRVSPFICKGIPLFWSIETISLAILSLVPSFPWE